MLFILVKILKHNRREGSQDESEKLELKITTDENEWKCRKAKQKLRMVIDSNVVFITPFDCDSDWRLGIVAGDSQHRRIL